MDPITIAIIAAGLKAAEGGMKAAQEKKLSKKRSKQSKRETYGDLFSGALQREAELEGQRLSSGARKGRRKAQSYQDTSDLVRGALGI